MYFVLLLSVVLADGKQNYVRVPGMEVAVRTDDKWKNEFAPMRGGQVWPRRNERGVVAGSIHFLLVPKLSETVKKQAEEGAAALKKAPFYVKEGKHHGPIQVDGRTAYVSSYFAKLGEKDLYTIQVTVEYDDKRCLLLSCSRGIGLIDDISEELLAKVGEIRFQLNPP